jgi:protocatechuate 3,4-dioxygenase beta subunit
VLKYLLFSVSLLLSTGALARAAVLEGTVVESRSGRPLARSTIILYQLREGSLSRQDTARGDSAGRFAFASLPPGAYVVAAERPGFAPARYGQKRGGGGTPVVLAADGHFACELRLRRLGSITGEALDENGVGLPGITVLAYPSQEQPLRIAQSAASDDRGVYRIAGLDPGRYVVRTAAHQLPDQGGLLPTYYGQTTSLAEARVVDVELDAESPGVSIQPIAGKLGRIEGKVGGGIPFSLALYSETGRTEAAVTPNGNFVFTQLAPGEYELMAQAAGVPARAAWQRLRAGEGTQSTVLDMAPWPAVRVRVETTDARAAAPQAWVTLKRTRLTHDLPVPRIPAGASVELLPGEYSASAQSGPEGYVMSLRTSQGPGGDFTALARAVIEIIVTVCPRPAAISGKVVTENGTPVAGAPVFLSPIDGDLRRRLGGARAVRSGEDGTYRFAGLAPGSYQVLSSFDFDSPEQVPWAVEPARTVPLEESQDLALDIRLSGSM